MSQLAAVKIRSTVGTVPSVVSLEALEEMGTVTSAVGLESSTTVKLAVPPASVVTRPEVGVTVIPGAACARATVKAKARPIATATAPNSSTLVADDPLGQLVKARDGIGIPLRRASRVVARYGSSVSTFVRAARGPCGCGERPRASPYPYGCAVART